MVNRQTLLIGEERKRAASAAGGEIAGEVVMLGI